MSIDPTSGISAQALAAAQGAPLASGEASSSVEEVVSPLMSRDQTFASRTRDESQRRARSAGHSVNTMEGARARIVERGRNMIDEALDELPEPRAVLHQGRTAIQDQPTTALFIAAAIGFGLGWLIHRRDS